MKINKLLHEPLLHFLLLGVGLFLLYGQLNPEQPQQPDRITITQADVDRLAETWLRRTGRLPTEQEKQAQLEAYIREQVLYREARQLGLDQNDIIVRRRLAQKMEFLFRDLVFIDKPDETALRQYLAQHPESFTRPATVSFSQIYVDPARHGEQARHHAQQLLTDLQAGRIHFDSGQAGDPVMLPSRQDRLAERQVASLFGEVFARQLFRLPVGQWQGPVESAYGLHLVRIDQRQAARLPELADIREQVESQWRASERRKANEAFYQGLRQRYDVVLDIDMNPPTRLSAK